MRQIWTKKGGLESHGHSRKDSTALVAKVLNWLFAVIAAVIVLAGIGWLAVSQFATLPPAQVVLWIFRNQATSQVDQLVLSAHYAVLDANEVTVFDPNIVVSNEVTNGVATSSGETLAAVVTRLGHGGSLLTSLPTDAYGHHLLFGRLIDRVVEVPTKSPQAVSGPISSVAWKALESGAWKDFRLFLSWSNVLPKFGADPGVVEVKTIDGWNRWRLSPPLRIPDRAVCTLAVVNATTTSGLASLVATLLESSGGVVVTTTETETPHDQSMVLIDAEARQRCEQTAVWAAQALVNPEIQWSNELPTEEKQQFTSYRAQVVLFVGSDTKARIKPD